MTKSKLEEEKRFWNVNFFAVSLNNLATHTADFRDAHFIFISLVGSGQVKYESSKSATTWNSIQMMK